MKQVLILVIKRGLNSAYSYCAAGMVHTYSRHGTHIHRVGQNCIYTPYLTVYLVNTLPKIPYTHRIYMVLANPTHTAADMV
jgi:hypothetical protein